MTRSEKRMLKTQLKALDNVDKIQAFNFRMFLFWIATISVIVLVLVKS